MLFPAGREGDSQCLQGPIETAELSQRDSPVVLNVRHFFVRVPEKRTVDLEGVVPAQQGGFPERKGGRLVAVVVVVVRSVGGGWFHETNPVLLLLLLFGSCRPAGPGESLVVPGLCERE